MLKRTVAISTLLHVSVGAGIFYLFSLQHPPVKPKVLPITFVALQKPLHVEQKRSEPQPKESEQKPQTKSVEQKPVEQKQPPLPVQETKTAVKTPEKPLEQKPLEQKPVEQKIVQKTQETLKEQPQKVQKSEPKLSAAESKNIKNKYLGALYASIDKLKVYPKNAKRLGQSGTVKVKFTVLKDGTITNISLGESCGFAILDDAAKKILITLAKTAPIPKELDEESLNISVPVVYE